MILCGLVCLLTACHDDDEPEAWEKGRAARTVMVYMAGENNLTVNSGTRYLRNDLNEIIEGSKQLADNQRLLVFVDSMVTTKSDTLKDGRGLPCIIEVHGGQVYKRHEFGQEVCSSDPAVFREVLQWMAAEAEADEYGLVLWGHATGWMVHTDTIASARTVTKGYGQDDGSDAGGTQRRWMNITQMAKAMAGLPKLKFIFADCCNMMCAEVGYELRNATDYLIGSPAEIPGNGAPYDKLIASLYKSGSDLYRGVIDAYYNYYLDEYRNDSDLKGCSLPLAVIDTKQIENLAYRTRDVLATFTPEYPKSASFGNIAFYFYYYDTPLMYDMRAYIKHNATEADFALWDQAFSQAVPYYRMSMKWLTIYKALLASFRQFDQDEGQYGCVSMFVPKTNYYYTTGGFQYNKTVMNFSWAHVVGWPQYGW